MLFGAGKQIESHINVFLRHYRGIKSCTIVNRTLNERALDLFKSATGAFHLVTFHLFSKPERESIENAVRTADVIICATSATAPLFPSSWVKSGAHVVIVGSYKPHMQEVEEELVKRSLHTSPPDVSQRIHQALIVDSREACLKEAGDLLKAGIDGALMCEIGELVLRKGSEPVKEHLSQRLSDAKFGFRGPITMFKSVGVGLQDVVMAKEVVSHAKNMQGIGTLIERYDAAY